MRKSIMNYQQQAIDFMNKVGATITIEYLKTGKHFEDDKDKRDIYEITISKRGRSYKFNFGQSIVNSGFYYTKGKQQIAIDRKYLTKGPKELALFIRNNIDFEFINNGKSDIIHEPVKPTYYDILACLTKNDPGTFEEFCNEFGYDTDSRKAEKTYISVRGEYLNVSRLFSDDELEQLQEIS